MKNIIITALIVKTIFIVAEAETWSTLDDTWLLVLIVSSIGVLLLGALLAMFLLKCRE